MKKQGMPEPLSEAHFANLKRKAAGLSVTEARADAKKRRLSAEAEELADQNIAPKKAMGKREAKRQRAKEAETSKKNSGLKNESKGNFANGKATSKDIGRKITKSESKSRGKQPAALVPLPESEEDEDEDVVDSDEDELMNDEFDDEQVLGDDFLGSDAESASDVYDSEEDHAKGKMFSDDDDSDSGDEERLTAANMAGLTRKLDEQMAKEAEDAEAELQESGLQTNIVGDRPKILEDDSDEEGGVKTNALLAPDLQLLRTRINDTVRVLDDFANLSEEGRSRAEYTAQLLKDICAYYGYSEYLAEKLYNLFPPREAFAFFEANETPRPVVLRTNTLKTHRRDLAQALINRGVVLEPVGKWSKVGLQVFESAVPLGATPEYLAGHYILQAASSFLPVMALAPQEHERVLDMASAPGGKTTYIAALMKNTGCIFANDSNKARAKGLIGNIHRLGVRNAIVCNYDAREFPKVIGGFDRVLLDAPCSGTGVIAKDASVKTNKTEKDFLMLPHLQKQLLLAAIDSVDHASKTGGYIVYSTCSVTVEENEGVVQYALSKRPNVRLVETGLVFGKEGFTAYMGKTFDKRMSMTRRYYPHAYNVDGFFVAKFKKTGPSPANSTAGKTNGIVANTDDLDVDKRPISETEGEDDDDFAQFSEDEDKEIMERAERKLLKKKGLNPKAKKENAIGEKPRKDKAPKNDTKKVASAVKETMSEVNGAVPSTESTGKKSKISKKSRKSI